VLHHNQQRFRYGSLDAFVVPPLHQSALVFDLPLRALDAPHPSNEFIWNTAHETPPPMQRSHALNRAFEKRNAKPNAEFQKILIAINIP
jgi:hypothetical protein